MASMLGQMLSEEQRRALDGLGAIEEEIEVPGGGGGGFVVTAARGGDDLWVEVRRRKEMPVSAAGNEPETSNDMSALPVLAEAAQLAPDLSSRATSDISAATEVVDIEAREISGADAADVPTRAA